MKAGTLLHSFLCSAMVCLLLTGCNSGGSDKKSDDTAGTYTLTQDSAQGRPSSTDAPSAQNSNPAQAGRTDKTGAALTLTQDSAQGRPTSINAPSAQDSNSNPAQAGKPEKAGVAPWQLASDSKVEFDISNFGMNVHGTLNGLKADILFDENHPEKGSFNATIPVNTINTGIRKRDKDLMDEKYFSTAQYPQISFKTDNISSSGSGHYMAHGILTIKGKSQKMNMPFSFISNGSKGVFESRFNIERLDFDIGGSGPIMGKTISVHLLVPVSRAG